MLLDVLQRLQAAEVDRRFDVRRVAREILRVNLDVERRAARNSRERVRQSPLDEQGGRDPVRDSAHLSERRVDVAAEFVEHRLRASGVGTEDSLGHAQLHPQRDQALLGSVVQVALDAPPFRVECCDRPGASCGHGRLEAVGLQRERRGGGERVEQLRMVEQRRVVRECCYRRAVGAGHARHSPLRRPLRKRDHEPVRSCVGVRLGEPVGDLERGVLQGLGHHRAQLRGSGPRAQAAHEPLECRGVV